MTRYRSVDLGDDYVVHFTWTEKDELYAQVAFEGTLVAKGLFPNDLWAKVFGLHTEAANWASREVRRHKKAMSILQKERGNPKDRIGTKRGL